MKVFFKLMESDKEDAWRRLQYVAHTKIAEQLRMKPIQVDRFATKCDPIPQNLSCENALRYYHMMTQSLENGFGL